MNFHDIFRPSGLGKRKCVENLFPGSKGSNFNEIQTDSYPISLLI